jgi:hypothetical protein
MNNNLNRRSTDAESCAVCSAQNEIVDRHLTLATAACQELQARGFAVWGIFVGNVCPIIRLRWTPACDEVLERGEAMWRRVQTVDNERVYTYAWPFMDCRVEWTLQGDLH